MIKKNKKNKKCVFNFNNFSMTNILLFILIILVVVLIVFSILNLNQKENFKYDNSFSVDDLNSSGNIVDNNSTYIADFKSYLDQFGLQESELINKVTITTENVDELNSKYNFIFNESLINSYDFEMTSLNDIIFEFKDYVMVYDPTNENFKSIWLVQYISN
jgi:uncharacterized protein involved in exopolysaccharide biosynthesis